MENMQHTQQNSFQKKEKKYQWAIAFLIVVIVAFGAFQLGANSNSATTGGAAINTQPTNNVPTQQPIVDIKLKDTDYVLGNTDAEVLVVEYSDFQCPFCSRMYSETVSKLKSDYVDSGKIAFVYRHFPLSFHPEAQKAAEASECAGEQGKFWEMHDLLFENQASLSLANYKKWAGELGLTQNQFDECLDSGKYETKIKADFAEGSQLGVRGTPATFINGRLVSGAQPYQAFQSLIDAEL